MHKKLIIIGSGPAGYTAAIYASRADLAPLVFAGESFGGQLMNTTLVENWPGSKEGILGPELMMNMREQAVKFGAEMVDRKVDEVDFGKQAFRMRVGDVWYESEAVIVATGAESIMLGIPGEKELLGRGVATCAVCDAAFYRDKTVFVVGGGDAAVEDTLALTKYANSVTMVVRKNELKASKIMAKRVVTHPKVKMMWNSEVVEIKGEGKVAGLVIANNQTSKKKEVSADGIFMAIGHKPVTGIFHSKLELDKKGYLITGLNGLTDRRVATLKAEETETQKTISKMWLEGFPTMTSVPGVFGAGDVVDFRYKQAVTAAAMGCQAALDVEKWLQDRE